MKNYKKLSKKEKRNVLLGLGGILAVILVLFLIFKPEVSNNVVGQAAFQVAEQDYGYKLDLKSYNIVDSFTAKSKTIAGDTFKAKMYLVVVEGEAKDTNGQVVETVKYGVSVVDPRKSGKYVVYNQTSHAENCTEMDNIEIEELLRSATAGFH